VRRAAGVATYPALTMTNYFDWALLIKMKLNARALWNIIEDGGIDQQEEMMALDALCGAVPLDMVPMITKKETMKEA
jgi:hypothetical protein